MTINLTLRPLWMAETYQCASSITTPNTRWLLTGSHGKATMFHTEIGDCIKLDSSNMCKGHAMSRDEFIANYCAGIEPVQLNDIMKEKKWAQNGMRF